MCELFSFFRFFFLFSSYNKCAVLHLRGPNNVSRTFFDTNTATDALIVVDRRLEIVNGYRLCGAEPLADLASNAARIAIFLGNCALIDRHTTDPMLTVVRYQLDYMLRASFNTRATSLAFFVINDGNALDNGDRIKFASGNTSAESGTTVRAGAVSSAELCGGNAIANALVNILFP